jgi:hypothetical protein
MYGAHEHERDLPASGKDSRSTLRGNFSGDRINLPTA